MISELKQEPELQFFLLGDGDPGGFVRRGAERTDMVWRPGDDIDRSRRSAGHRSIGAFLATHSGISNSGDGRMTLGANIQIEKVKREISGVVLLGY